VVARIRLRVDSPCRSHRATVHVCVVRSARDPATAHPGPHQHPVARRNRCGEPAPADRQGSAPTSGTTSCHAPTPPAAHAPTPAAAASARPGTHALLNTRPAPLMTSPSTAAALRPRCSARSSGSPTGCRRTPRPGRHTDGAPAGLEAGLAALRIAVDAPGPHGGGQLSPAHTGRPSVEDEEDPCVATLR
jgi:hypothetical protein